MSDTAKKRLLRYVIASLIGVALVFLYLIPHRYFAEALETQERFRLLCDAFSIPGIVLLFSGLLIWCSGKGSFDGIGYSVGLFFRVVLPFRKWEKESYPDYVERKRKKREAGPGHAYLYVTGGVFLLVAAVFLILFYVSGEGVH